MESLPCKPKEISKEELLEKINKLEVIVKKSGMEQKANLNIAIEFIAQDLGKEYSTYAKDFLLTMITYLDAYKQLGTGIVKANIQTSTLQDSASFACKLLGYMPVVGDIFSFIQEHLDKIIEMWNEKKMEAKIENIQKVVDGLSGWDPETMNRQVAWGVVHMVYWFKSLLSGRSGKEDAAKFIGYLCGVGSEFKSCSKDADYFIDFSSKNPIEQLNSPTIFGVWLINGMWNMKKFKMIQL